MCSPHGHIYWVIIVGGRIGVFPVERKGHLKSFPPLEELYDNNQKLRTDAKEKLLELLDDPHWTS